MPIGQPSRQWRFCHSLARADTANQTQISSARPRDLFLQRDRITPLRPRSFAELFLPECAADSGLNFVSVWVACSVSILHCTFPLLTSLMPLLWYTGHVPPFFLLFSWRYDEISVLQSLNSTARNRGGAVELCSLRSSLPPSNFRFSVGSRTE